MIIATVLSLLVLLYWDFYIEMPRQKSEALTLRSKAVTEAQVQAETGKQQPPAAALSRAELMTQSPRVTITSPSLHGSIALKGLRIDDLTLARYRETLAPDSPEVTLFSPADDAEGYFAEVGWASADKALALPTPDTLWSRTVTLLRRKNPSRCAGKIRAALRSW